MSMVLMWLTGFFTDEDDPPVVDFDKLKDGCWELTIAAEESDDQLMTAAEEICSSRARQNAPRLRMPSPKSSPAISRLPIRSRSVSDVPPPSVP